MTSNKKQEQQRKKKRQKKRRTQEGRKRGIVLNRRSLIERADLSCYEGVWTRGEDGLKVKSDWKSVGP